MYAGRIYTISDLHVDQKANMEWVENLSDNNYSWDTLIVAGDITHDIRKLFHTLRILREKFREVYFCPGSHELWIVGEDDKKKYGISNSIEKFHYILKWCEAIGIKTKPGITEEGVVILPLYAWYDDSLYIPMDDSITDPYMLGDTYHCQWTDNVTAKTASKYFVELNEKNIADVIKNYGNAPVITFSHFFTSKKLMEAYSEHLTSNEPFKVNFSAVAGTELLNKQLQQIKPKVHIFGHSHRKMTLDIGDGIKYINNPLGYARERQLGLIEGPYEIMQIDV